MPIVPALTLVIFFHRIPESVTQHIIYWDNEKYSTYESLHGFVIGKNENCCTKDQLDLLFELSDKSYEKNQY